MDGKDGVTLQCNVVGHTIGKLYKEIGSLSIWLELANLKLSLQKSQKATNSVFQRGELYFERSKVISFSAFWQ